MTDVLTRGHLLGISFVQIYKTVKVPNNTDRTNRIYCYLLFLLPNKSPFVRPERGTRVDLNESQSGGIKIKQFQQTGKLLKKDNANKTCPSYQQCLRPQQFYY